VSRARRAATIAVVGVLLLFALVARPALAAPPPLAWVPPTDARVVPPGQLRRGGVPSLVADPTEPVVLERGAMLVFPADPGDPVRIEAHDVDIGFGTGKDELPDLITWAVANDPASVHELSVPTWSSARFVAVRAKTGRRTTVRAFVASRTSTPIVWYRADEEVAAWLLDDQAEPAFEGELSLLAPERTAWLGALRLATTSSIPSSARICSTVARGAADRP